MNFQIELEEELTLKEQISVSEAMFQVSKQARVIEKRLAQLAEQNRVYENLLRKCKDYIDHPEQKDYQAWELIGELQEVLDDV